MNRIARPQPRPWAARRLVCMGFAGGGTVAFRPWARLLPLEVELRTLCYPGREYRYADEITGGWDGFVADCADAVATEVRAPYVLYGHSMGALLAFETARLLQERGAQGPESVILSGHIAPQHWTGVRSTKLVTASDEELAESLKEGGGLPQSVIGDPDLLAMAVDLLRMDMEAYAAYEFRREPRLRAPLHLMVGEDELTPAHDGWEELTEGGFTRAVLPGGHFFTPRVWGQLPRHMPAFLPDGAAELAG
ncbi:thioesterase II family protein [Streptomyces sp. RK9]|uniref:thioesterase II family protein n=1 Tax=Streptomyces sp. RK9 TaxID=3239284 RepID=UPI00386E2DDE